MSRKGFSPVNYYEVQVKQDGEWGFHRLFRKYRLACRLVYVLGSLGYDARVVMVEIDQLVLF